jgi:cAMP-dependent protein kinase regulator
MEEDVMKRTRALGKVHQDGEVIVRQGEVGDSMCVSQDGQAEVVVGKDGEESHLATLGEGDFIGEMAIFEREVRMASVRAVGEARV